MLKQVSEKYNVPGRTFRYEREKKTKQTKQKLKMKKSVACLYQHLVTPGTAIFVRSHCQAEG